MRLVVAPSPEDAAAGAAVYIAAELRKAIAARSRATLALSGGATAPALLACLAAQALDWSRVHVFQVDERIAAYGSSARNVTAIDRELVTGGPLPPTNLYRLPVDEAPPEAAVRRYEESLRTVAGNPPTLDVVHLGLGTDGHMASLFPGDSALTERKSSVTITRPHAGYQRMTLTLPVLNAARSIVWLVTGASKADIVEKITAGRVDLPSVQVRRATAVLFADAAAAGHAALSRR